MKLPTFLRRAEQDFIPAPRVEGLDGLIKQVWESPADWNRTARRKARLWGRIWKWDAAALGLQNIPPRYVRRHFDSAKFTNPRTRRQRRHRARILRAMKGAL